MPSSRADLTVRRARPGDVEVIARYNEALARESEDVHLDASRLRAGVAQVLGDDRKGVYFIAEIDGRAVGQTLITYEWSDWRNGVFWWIQSVYVEPEQRGTGVFRRLFEHIRSSARSDPAVCGLRLYVDQDNDRARQVYLRMGLRQARYAMMEEDFVLTTHPDSAGSTPPRQ